MEKMQFSKMPFVQKQLEVELNLENSIIKTFEDVQDVQDIGFRKYHNETVKLFNMIEDKKDRMNAIIEYIEVIQDIAEDVEGTIEDLENVKKILLSL
jgi:hypothetical protein